VFHTHASSSGNGAHASRVAASVLLAAGTPQTIARTMEDYIDIVCRLAQQGGLKARQIRTQLLRTRSCSCLGNAAVWAAKVSAAMK
jgi:predicted O-linked N-acetylglucosamine transferase (SPINDLY family)